jgi:hypothetical protein
MIIILLLLGLIVWFVHGVFVLANAHAEFPTNIKEFCYQSFVTGPLGILYMICFWYVSRYQ